MSKKIAALVGIVLGAAIVGAVAFAAWTSNGSGSGTAQSTQDKDSAISAEASAADLYPGATESVTVRITNPNDYPVIVTGISAGSSTAVEDCAADTVRSDARQNVAGIAQTGSAGAVIAPNSSGVYALTTRMSNDPSNACKNQTFDLPMTATLASAATAQDFSASSRRSRTPSPGPRGRSFPGSPVATPAHRRSRRARTALSVVLVVAALGLWVGTAAAWWASPATGSARATSGGVPAPAAPTAAVVGRTVAHDPVTGPVLAASPSTVAAGAVTDVSVVLPAGTPTGTHGIYALAGGEVASTTVAVVANGSPTALAWLTNRDGRARTGDSLRVTYSQPLSLSSLAPSDPDGDVNVVVSLLDDAAPNGDDVLRVAGLGGAPVAFGEIDLGSSAFAVNDITFGTADQPSTLRWRATDRTLTLAFGRESSSSAKTVTTAVTATYRPGAGLRTSTGGSVTGSAVAAAVAF